jgi:hypothetical protein
MAAIPLDQYPPDLVQAVAEDAAADAERVAMFLTDLGLRPAGEGTARVPLHLPLFFLLGLKTAFRLAVWERGGLHAHRDAGLPSAREVLREAFRMVTAPEPPEEKDRAATQLACRVLGVFVERLAWNGRSLLDADVELREADEDALVDALAKFLWTHRHDGDNAGPTKRG